jgi:hypothetical protein
MSVVALSSLGLSSIEAGLTHSKKYLKNTVLDNPLFEKHSRDLIAGLVWHSNGKNKFGCPKNVFLNLFSSTWKKFP